MTEETMQPIHPGCVRIIVKLGDLEGGGDFLAEALPDWLKSLDAAARNPLVWNTEYGAEIAREMAFEAAKAGEWDIACISALWIALYAPDAAGVSLDELMRLPDVGVVRITATDGGCTWHCQVTQFGEPSAVFH